MYNQTSSVSDNVNVYQEKIANFSEEFDLGVFIAILKNKIKWVILLYALAIVGAFVYLRYTPLLFEASAILQMTSQNTAQKVLNVENIYEQDVAGEIELIRSKAFLTNALSRLNLDISYYSKGKILDSEIYKSSPYLVVVRNVAPEMIGKPIYVSFPTAKKIFTSYHVGEDVFEQPIALGMWDTLGHLEIKIDVTNFSEISKQQDKFALIPYFFTINDRENEMNKYFRLIEVRVLNEAAKTIQITVKENNSHKTADIVNAIASEFVESDVEKKSQSATKILEFIDNQLIQVYDQLRSSENKMQSFKRDNKLSQQGDFITVYVDKLDRIEMELMDLELETSMLDEISEMVTQEDDIDVYNLLPALTGLSFQKEIGISVQALHKLLADKEEILYTATPQSEALKGIDYQIGIQKKILVASIQALSRKFNTKKTTLEAKIKVIENKFFNLPTQELEYARLLRLFTINEKFYTSLLEKKAEYSISKAGFVSKNVILESATPPTIPISPDRKKIYALALVLSTIISVLIIALSYLRHNEITSVNELENGCLAAFLGIVPMYKKDIPISQLLVDKNPKSLIAESFRSIRTNLQFINNDPGSKIIAITSTVSGEGKTFITINLSGIIAFSDKKVITLDLDLRKPKIHLGFNFDNEKGISTILSGKDKLEDCIHASSIANLDVITAGPIPPNPSELIIGESMNKLLDDLKQLYDVIVIDNPPVGIVTDGISMIQRADYPIYVFRANISKKNFIGNVDRLITESKIKNLSVILNGIDTDNAYGYSYNYGYGYGYAYGYGYYDEEADMKKKTRWQRLFSS